MHGGGAVPGGAARVPRPPHVRVRGQAVIGDRRGVAQPGSAPALEAGGRRIEAPRPDHSSPHCPRTPRARHVRDRRSGEGVYIGRPTKWGNPFKIGRDGTREQVIAKFEAWVAAQPALISDGRRELRGRDLFCHCAPLPCHGGVWLRIVNAP